MNHHDQQSPVFIVRLTPDQRVFINSILGRGYSLQPGIAGSAGPKTASVRKNVINYKEQSAQQKDQQNSKRRKTKSYEVIEGDQLKQTAKKCDELSKMANIVRKLKKHEASWPFRHPVDAKALSIPNYTEIVLVPMDLQTIQQKIRIEKYLHASEIERDITQMLLNSYKFNSKEGEYFEATSKLEQYYQSILQINQGEDGRSVGKKQIPGRPKNKDEVPCPRSQENQKSNQISQFQKDLLNLLKKANQMACIQKKVRQKPIYVSAKHEGPISIKQKRQLAQEIRSLDQVHLSRIVQLIRHNSKQNSHEQNKNGNKNQVIGIDIEKLDNKTIRELQNYVRLQKNSVVHDKEESANDSQENHYGFC